MTGQKGTDVDCRKATDEGVNAPDQKTGEKRTELRDRCHPKDIAVSINIITYNQERYVAQMLESVLSQRTDFDCEILIADDASDDGTAEVLKDYAGRYPDLIRLTLRKENVGSTANSYDDFMNSRGKYIAGIEGDDYWLSEDKLQDQLDFLEENPKYIGFQGKCRIVDENSEAIDTSRMGREFWNFCRDEYTLDDFCRWEMPGQMSALMYRNIYRDKGTDFRCIYRNHHYVGDRTIMMFLAAKGNIYCAPDIMTAYRYVPKGGSNWMSVYKSRNMRFDDYVLMTKIDRYLREKLRSPKGLDYAKKDRVAGAASVYLGNPTAENREVLRKIIRYDGHSLEKRILVLRVRLWKWYCRRILKEERRFPL